MTIPNMQQVPTAHRPWQQMGGGYEQAVAQQQQQPGQVQLPTALQAQMQQTQPQMALPPQMQAMQDLNGSPSPLSLTQPHMPVPMQMRPPQMQQQQPQQMQTVQGADGRLYQVPATQFMHQQQPQQQQQQFPPNQQNNFQQQPQSAGAMVLQGPGVPQELQGRSLQDVIGMYQGLRQTHLQLMAQQPQQQPQQQNQQQNNQQQQQQPAFDWRNPGASVAQVTRSEMERVIDEKITPMIAPIAAQNAMSAIENARQQAAAAIGIQRFAAMEPQIRAMLNGADPSTLQNPRTWAIAAQAVAGQLVLSGVQSPIIQNQQGPGAFPTQQVQPGQNPMPNLNSFFSEQPNQGGPMGGSFQLSQAQVAAANAMGISLNDYAAWAQGVRNY